MRATLAEVLTEQAFERMIPLAGRWVDGVQKGIDDAGVPWHVTRLGCRAEYLFRPDPPRNGGRRTRPATSSSSATCTCTR